MNKMTIIAIVIAVLIIPTGILASVKYKDKKDTKVNTTENKNTEATKSASPSINPAAANSDYNIPADAVTAKKVILKTNLGDITLNLYADEAPLSVRNFSTLGKRGYYDGVIFHRVIKDFMIQTGDPQGLGTGGESIYGKTFATEKNQYKFIPGTLGMARTAVPDSNGSQFFIVSEQNQPSLDGQYTIFGQAEEASMPIVKAIAAVSTDENDKPKEEVKITGFQIVE